MPDIAAVLQMCDQRHRRRAVETSCMPAAASFQASACQCILVFPTPKCLSMSRLVIWLPGKADKSLCILCRDLEAALHQQLPNRAVATQPQDSSSQSNGIDMMQMLEFLLWKAGQQRQQQDSDGSTPEPPQNGRL
jgi:hypothetical protein